MRIPFLTILVILVLTLFTSALGQTVSVQVMADAAIPTDFGTAYPLGQLSNNSYVYGPNFIIKVSYTDLSNASLSFSLSGSQANYELAWRVDSSILDNAFGTSLGNSVTGLSGSASDLYYVNSGSLSMFSTDATRYQIGARATPAASVDLDTQITLTATLN